MEDGSEPRSLLDPDTLRRLLRQLEQTDVNELEVVTGTARLYLRREPGAVVLSAKPNVREAETPGGVAIVSPLAGLFYARPTPADPPFVEVGSAVLPGQVVALIETMKIFNEIKAEIAGEVIEITSQEGDLVEAGKPLMYLRPMQGEQE
jgi:acetyl-CoA carboxylase biotin carboxyl carrier protein